MVLAALAAGGCGQRGDTGGPVAQAVPKAAKVEPGETGHHYKGRDWCAEHGVPESVCGQCDVKLAAEFKKKGDWCKEHDRPDSQCFLHHPELKARFAADYKAKYGEDPPPVEEEEKGR